MCEKCFCNLKWSERDPTEKDEDADYGFGHAEWFEEKKSAQEAMELEKAKAKVTL